MSIVRMVTPWRVEGIGPCSPPAGGDPSVVLPLTGREMPGGDARLQGRSGARPRGDAEPAAQQVDALLHAEEAEAAGAGTPARVESDAVVADAHPDLPLNLGERDLDGLRRGVLQR